MNDSIFYKDWLAKAADDEMSIRPVLKDGAPSVACFLSQQMTEKLLKGLLIYNHKEFPKIHDLVALGEMLQPIYPEVNVLVPELQQLTQFYITSRYPADYPEFTLTEARQAFEAAVKIKEFVKEKIKE